MRLWPARVAPDPKPDAVVVGDRAVPLVVRVNPRARRVALKVDAAAGRVVLVIPHKRDEKAARRFLHSRTDWLHTALERLPPAVALADGASVPLGGVPHTVRHCPDARRGVWLEDGEIRVSGQAEHLPRRLRDWLKGQARTAITARVAVHAEALGVTPGRITVKDTRSRWGSCAPSGVLSFSWRLVMAPDWVLDYVTAHEVAHLRELNHSPAFWRHVETLAPGLRGPARDWLRDHGAALHRVG